MPSRQLKGGEAIRQLLIGELRPDELPVCLRIAAVGADHSPQSEWKQSKTGKLTFAKAQ